MNELNIRLEAIALECFLFILFHANELVLRIISSNQNQHFFLSTYIEAEILFFFSLKREFHSF